MPTSPAPDGPRSIACYHCGRALQVGRKTQSTNCPDCNQRVIVEDVVIKQLTPVRQVRTCGRLVVQSKGSVIAESILAGAGVEVLGHLEGHVVSGGPVIIGPKARWKGDCRAPSLAVADGARIESGRFAVPAEGPG